MSSNKNFNERCYELLKQIPEGKVVTYADIAHQLGGKAYQAVGNAMASNPNLITVPCHRVVNSDGRIGKYALGSDKKVELLRHEGIAIKDNKVQELAKYRYQFS